jgi:hypothetical protein
MYFSLYQTVHTRRAPENMPCGEIDISHRFTRQLSEWLKGMFSRPSGESSGKEQKPPV